MNRSFLAAALIILLITSAAAQQESTARESPDTQAGNGRPNPTLIEGCLDGPDGGYTLTDDSGTLFFLTGNIDKLEPFIGQRVRLNGKQTSNALIGRGGFATSDTNVGTLPSFRVVTVSKIADSCKSRTK
jgi:hypothetical protein